MNYKPDNTMGGFASLFKSRKVLLALLAVIQTLVMHYMDVPVEVWASIDGLLVVLIGSIAHEDAAQKRSAPYMEQNIGETTTNVDVPAVKK